jgi:acetylornithine deacetylase
MLEAKMAQRVLDSIDDNKLVRLLQEVIKIPSYTGEEKNMAEFLGKKLDTLGMEVEFQEVLHGRPNVIGRLKGRGPGLSLMFNGHMDHNMVCRGWVKDPFGGEIEDGCVYGVGAGNMKAGNAAYIGAIEAIVKSGLSISQLHIRTKMAGSVQLRIKIFGEMRHFSTDSPVNHAIENMMKVIQALGPCHTSLEPEGAISYTPRPGFEGLPQWNVAAIRGGMTEECLDWRPALVPDFCSIIADVRILPGQSLDSVMEDFRNIFGRLKKEDPNFSAQMEPLGEYCYVPPCDMGLDHRVVDIVKYVHKFVTGAEPFVEQRSSFAFSDAVHLVQAGIKGLEYGPGGANISTPVERVKIEDYLTAAKVYALAAAEACGGG